MLVLRLKRRDLLKKVVESIKDLTPHANFHCSANGFALQAMDSSHVALVDILLSSDRFEHYRCDRNISLRLNIANMADILRHGSDDDTVTMKADYGRDTVTFMFLSPSKDQTTIVENKLMDIDSDQTTIVN
ncbi:hypothetical protein DITRI_Ditri09bG0144900 [Diplodiscus trichospermus]